jgi:hypothetical protein
LNANFLRRTILASSARNDAIMRLNSIRSSPPELSASTFSKAYCGSSNRHDTSDANRHKTSDAALNSLAMHSADRDSNVAFYRIQSERVPRCFSNYTEFKLDLS